MHNLWWLKSVCTLGAGFSQKSFWKLEKCPLPACVPSAAVLLTVQCSMYFQSCCVTSSAMTLQRRVTVLLDSWTALIEDIISILFLVPKRVCCFNKCLFYHFAILERLIVFNDGVTHSKWGFSCCLRFWSLPRENDCCTDSCNFCSFTFLFLISLFGGKFLVTAFMNIPKVLLH